MRDPHWVTDWSEIDADQRYLVCPILSAADGATRLGRSIDIMPGWRVQQLEQSYATLLLPEWDGLPPKEKRHAD